MMRVRPEVHTKNARLLADLARKHGWPKRVADVGIYCPEACETMAFVQDLQCEVVMFEPQPEGFAALKEEFGGLANVTLHNVALVDVAGPALLHRPKDRCVGDAFIHGAVTPGHRHRDTVMVEGRWFSDYDDGSFDLVQIDVEGADWWVIKHMVSRPKILVVEWKIPKLKWANACQREINEWAKANGYTGQPFASNDRAFIR